MADGPDKENGFSLQEVRAKLHNTLHSTGLVSSLKMQVRKHVVQEIMKRGHDIPPSILSGAAGPKPLSASLLPLSSSSKHQQQQAASLSLDARIAASIIADHLQQNQCLNTLSIFMPESGLTSAALIKGTNDILQCLGFSPSSNARLFARLSAPSSPKSSLNSILHRIVHLLSDLSHQSQTESSCQTPASGRIEAEGLAPSLDDKLAELEARLLGRSSSSGSPSLLSQPSLEERMMQYQMDCDRRARDEIETEVRRIRSVELSRVRSEESAKYREEVLAMRTELDKKHALAMERLAARDRELSERIERRERELDQKAFESRQSTLEELERLKERERTLERQVQAHQLQSSQLHADMERLKREREELDKERETWVVTRGPKDPVEQLSRSLRSDVEKEVLKAKQDLEKQHRQQMEVWAKDKEMIAVERRDWDLDRQRLKDAEARVDELRHALAQSETMVLSMQKELQDTRHKEKMAEAQVESLRKQILESGIGPSSSSSQAAGSLESQLSHTQIAYADLKAREASAQQSIQQARKQITSLETELKSLSDHFKRISRENSSLQKELASESASAEGLLRQLEDERLKSRSLQREVDDLRKSVEDAQRALESAIRAKAEALAHATSLASSISSSSSAFALPFGSLSSSGGRGGGVPSLYHPLSHSMSLPSYHHRYQQQQQHMPLQMQMQQSPSLLPFQMDPRFQYMSHPMYSASPSPAGVPQQQQPYYMAQPQLPQSQQVSFIHHEQAMARDEEHHPVSASVSIGQASQPSAAAPAAAAAAPSSSLQIMLESQLASISSTRSSIDSLRRSASSLPPPQSSVPSVPAAAPVASTPVPIPAPIEPISVSQPQQQPVSASAAVPPIESPPATAAAQHATMISIGLSVDSPNLGSPMGSDSPSVSHPIFVAAAAAPVSSSVSSLPELNSKLGLDSKPMANQHAIPSPAVSSVSSSSEEIVLQRTVHHRPAPIAVDSLTPIPAAIVSSPPPSVLSPSQRFNSSSSSISSSILDVSSLDLSHSVSLPLFSSSVPVQGHSAQPAAVSNNDNDIIKQSEESPEFSLSAKKSLFSSSSSSASAFSLSSSVSELEVQASRQSGSSLGYSVSTLASSIAMTPTAQKTPSPPLPPSIVPAAIASQDKTKTLMKDISSISIESIGDDSDLEGADLSDDLDGSFDHKLEAFDKSRAIERPVVVGHATPASQSSSASSASSSPSLVGVASKMSPATIPMLPALSKVASLSLSGSNSAPVSPQAVAKRNKIQPHHSFATVPDSPGRNLTALDMSDESEALMLLAARKRREQEEKESEEEKQRKKKQMEEKEKAEQEEEQRQIQKRIDEEKKQVEEEALKKKQKEEEAEREYQDKLDKYMQLAALRKSQQGSNSLMLSISPASSFDGAAAASSPSVVSSISSLPQSTPSITSAGASPALSLLSDPVTVISSPNGHGGSDSGGDSDRNSGGNSDFVLDHDESLARDSDSDKSAGGW